jgi:hypothetical protein
MMCVSLVTLSPFGAMKETALWNIACSPHQPPSETIEQSVQVHSMAGWCSGCVFSLQIAGISLAAPVFQLSKNYHTKKSVAYLFAPGYWC